MSQMSLCDELLSQQQEMINSFIRLLEEEISQNSQQVQCLIEEQCSSNLPRSILGQVDALIEKEQQNASNLKVLEELSKEAMVIVEEQHCRLEEVRMNLTTPLTSEAEASEPENYDGPRPKTTSRVNLTSIAPNALPQEAMAQTSSCHSGLRQRQPLETHAALLRGEIFKVILGTVNSQHGTASHNRKVKSGSNFSNDEVFHLPQVLDMPIAGSGHGHKVTLKTPVVRPRSISSTPCLVPQPVSFNVSGIPNIETSEKETDNEVEARPRAPHHKLAQMRNDASIASHSLQLKNLERSVNPKSRNLKVDIQSMPC